MPVVVKEILGEIPPEVLIELPCSKALDVAVDRMGIRAVDTDLFRHGEGHIVFLLRKFSDLLFIPGILRAKLVAGKPDHRKSFLLIFLPELLQPAELVGKASQGSCIDNEDHLVLEFMQCRLSAIDHGDLDIVKIHDCLLILFKSDVVLVSVYRIPTPAAGKGRTASLFRARTGPALCSCGT